MSKLNIESSGNYEKKVELIKALRHQGFTLGQIASYYGISKKAVTYVLAGELFNVPKNK